MGVNFTEEQRQVIDLRNRNILVSAAAGSGKTAVLVERIITRLTKDEPPLDVDQLLIVTFTEAAASEMKERIHAAIEKALEETPDNVHLQRQATLIHQAQITTIHKFCLSVIRDHFHTIDLDPGFRVAEEGELKLLKGDLVEDILEQAYQDGGQDYLDFVECFATGKHDRKLNELILQLYEFSRSYPNPKTWLTSCVEQYHITSLEELEKKPFVVQIRDEISQLLKDMEELLEFGIQICESEDGPIVYCGTLQADLLQIKRLRSTHSFAEMQQKMWEVKWDTLTACRDKTVSAYKIDQVKEIRDEVKNLIKKLTEQYFFADVTEMQKDLLFVERHMKTLTDLTIRFAEEFDRAKRSKNLIDFNDMEQFALQILTREVEGEFEPSQVAESYQQKFAEVMIDEYQDSNLVQEAILTSVSGVSQGRYNIFMVGDVKQSIYRFRLSRPELFMEKFNTYSQGESEKQRIDLHKNFRSRREVLHSTNFVFEQIMISEFGGIQYDDKAALYVGAQYEEKEGNETELLLVEADGYKAEERIELEAEAVAARIKQLVGNHVVFDKKTGEYRKARYGDIVILTRSVKGWSDVFASVLNQSGIPTYTSSREGYFQTPEIQLILNYLRSLDNPRQDIPFTAILTSMFGGVSDEELAKLRSSMDGKTIYECVCQYIQMGENADLRTRLSSFMDSFEGFRERVSYTAIHVLIWQLMQETGYGDYAAALPGGEQRAANLEMLVEKAVAFEGTSYKGLFNFVRYIEQLQKYNIDYGEANIMEENADVVCLMSIHKSKGLEFPIVFVAGMGKQFNLQDTRSSIVIHPELGVGMDVVDSVLRVKSPTLLKKAIQQQVQRESVAEELRVLYVAMTRAKEKLILTGSVVKLENELCALEALRGREELPLPYYRLAKAGRYLDWILASLYRNKCFGNILEEYEIPIPFLNPLYQKEIPVLASVVTLEELAEREAEEIYSDSVTKDILRMWETNHTYDADMKERIESQIGFEYPYGDIQVLKQKLSVSELKKRIYMDDEGKMAFKEEEVIPLLPKFLQEEEELTGASRGTAYHKLLEILDVTKDYDVEGLQREIAKKQERGLLSKEMANCINVYDILSFLQSPIGKRMQQAGRRGTYYVEQPFVLGIDAKQIYPDNDFEETVLVQGIVDAYFEEDGELVVVDYKTDYVRSASQLKERYHGQLEYYAQALSQLTDKKVKQKVIYSFALKMEIEV